MTITIMNEIYLISLYKIGFYIKSLLRILYDFFLSVMFSIRLSLTKIRLPCHNEVVRSLS